MEILYDLIAIGNAAIDIYVDVEDNFLEEHGLTKGGGSGISSQKADFFEQNLRIISREPGGAGANTVSCVQALGGKAAFIGCIAADKSGDIFIQNMKENGIFFQPQLMDESETTRIFILHTPDRERSFASCAGASDFLSPEDIDEDLIRSSSCLALDGFCLNAPRGFKTHCHATISISSAITLIICES
jgi:sugar/nucleoside kinase (ribokinase family)